MSRQVEFRGLGFRVSGFRVLGFSGLGFRVSFRLSGDVGLRLFFVLGALKGLVGLGIFLLTRALKGLGFRASSLRHLFRGARIPGRLRV